MNIEKAKGFDKDESYEMPSEVPRTQEIHETPGEEVPGAVVNKISIPDDEDDERKTDTVDKNPPKDWNPKNFN